MIAFNSFSPIFCGFSIQFKESNTKVFEGKNYHQDYLDKEILQFTSHMCLIACQMIAPRSFPFPSSPSRVVCPTLGKNGHKIFAQSDCPLDQSQSLFSSFKYILRYDVTKSYIKYLTTLEFIQNSKSKEKADVV